MAKRFLADGANNTLVFSSGSGLSWSFDRSVATVDPDGDPVAADEPRADRLVHIAAVPSSFETFYSAEPTASGYLLASGFDADGAELLFFLRTDNGHVVIFKDGDDDPLFTPYALTLREVGDESKNADPYHPTHFGDILSTASAPDHALQPKTAVIVHGAIIVGGPFWVRQSNGKYELLGWGFAINQDSGGQGEWRLFWSDEETAQPYIPRGLYWCMSAAPVHQRTEDPLACAICCANYMFKNDTQSQYQARSARAYYFRIQRTSTSAEWTVGQSPYLDGVMSFDIRAGATFQGETFNKVNHAHCCMATEWVPPTNQSDTPGVQLVVSIGDGQEHSRFVRFVTLDYLADYTDPDSWSPQEDYHGKADLDDSGSEPPLVATLSMQPGTCFFAPTAGDIIWCTDLTPEWVSLMKLPDGDDSPDQAQFEHLYGWATGYGHDPAHAGGWRSRPVFQGLSQPYPESSSAPIAIVYDEPLLEGREPEARRVLLCPNLSNPREWVQFAATHNVGSSPTVKIHDGYVYLSQVGSFGIKRIALPSLTPSSAPTLVAVRPLLVSCGGKNLVKAGEANGTGGSHFEEMDATQVVRLGRSATGGAAPEWTDPNGALNLGSAPTLATLGLKIRSTKDPFGDPDDSNYGVRLRLAADDATSWSTLPSGFAWATGTQVRRVRCWVRDGSYDQSGSLTPNKTNHIQVRPWDEDDGLNAGGNASWYSAKDRWGPCTFIGPRTISTGRALGLQINTHGEGAGSPSTLDDNYGYLVVGEAFDGNGALPYPMSPETDGPDEWLSVSDFSLGTNHNWWVKLALMVPMGNWDQWAGRGLFNSGTGQFESDRRWPLFTLWRDPNNWIEFSADCEGRGFRLCTKAQGGSVVTTDFGGGKQVWLPESPLLVAIGYTSSSGALAVGASLGGGIVQAPTSGLTWAGGGPLTVLKFRGAIGGHSNDGEVCEMRIIGGEIHDSGSLGSLPGAFTDLGFLNVS